ncbi:MAG: flagellar biosynthetic protein FliO [Acidobacteria bacterium]|nr:flagellar biosynthetic protein FliO [Acidobacteriota bacterium]
MTALWAVTLGWLRRSGALGPRRPSAIEVLDSRPLAPGHTLHLVRVRQRTLLVATHPAGCALLDNQPVETLPACSASR